MMRNSNNNDNGGWIFLALLAFLIFSNAGSVIFPILLMVGLFWLVRGVSNTGFIREVNRIRGNRATEEDEYEDIDPWEDTYERNRQAQTEPIYRHALNAVESAGLDPDNVPVLAVDIGVLAYRGNQSPQVFRTWTVPDDVDYIQPFVQLRLPSKATGLIKFEILDSSGNPIFVREDSHNLERGRNFITPAARMPIHDQQEMEGRWQLRLTADSVLLAVHKFEFADSRSASIRSAIGEDGEINTELRLIMEENKIPKMTLDDLLANQDDEDEQAKGRRA